MMKVFERPPQITFHRDVLRINNDDMITDITCMDMNINNDVWQEI